MALHSSLSNSLEDQLSLAALHFNRGNYQVLLADMLDGQKAQQVSVITSCISGRPDAL
jgi:hypothetical protein